MIEEIEALRLEKRMLEIQVLEQRLAFLRLELQREVENLERQYKCVGQTLDLRTRQWIASQEQIPCR